MKKVYIDTETTGLKPGQIAQISYIVEENNCLSKVVNQYFAVDSVDESASKVNGLTAEKLAALSDGVVFKDRSKEILADLKDAIFIAHNSAFDIRFISAEFDRLGISYIPDNSFCTMKAMKNIMKLPGRNVCYKYPSLKELMDYSKISESDVHRFTSAVFRTSGYGAHDSRNDCMAVYLVCKKLEKFGVFNIEETIELQSSLADIDI